MPLSKPKRAARSVSITSDLVHIVYSRVPDDAGLNADKILAIMIEYSVCLWLDADDALRVPGEGDYVVSTFDGDPDYSESFRAETPGLALYEFVMSAVERRA